MEPAFLEIPDPPYGGYVTSATWNKNSGDIVFDDMSEVGAIIYPVHYFEGYATVTCGYVFTYLGSYDNHYHAAQGSATYRISFISAKTELSESQIRLRAGDTKKVNLTISTDGWRSPTPEWTSKNEKVATVTNEGKIKGIRPGETDIIIDPIAGPIIFCHVIVESPVEPSGITINPNSLSLLKGQSYSLNYSFIPEESFADVTWTSSNEKVATVNNSGKVTAINEGIATITISTQNDLKAYSEVSVVPEPQSIKLISKAQIPIGYKITLVPVPYPENAISTYKWKSSNTAIATVSSGGAVKGIKEGEATITVTTANNVQGSTMVTVANPPSGMSVKEMESKLHILKTFLKTTIEAPLKKR